MTYLDDNCPVCKKIKKGEIVSAGDRCCTVKWAEDTVAVLSEHKDNASVDEVGEALDLLCYSDGKLTISGFEEAVGHWGLRATSRLEDGSSRVGVD
jgi:hypothetical protein